MLMTKLNDIYSTGNKPMKYKSIFSLLFISVAFNTVSFAIDTLEDKDGQSASRSQHSYGDVATFSASPILEENLIAEAQAVINYCPGHVKKERKGMSFHYSHWIEYCGGCATREVIFLLSKPVIGSKEEGNNF